MNKRIIGILLFVCLLMTPVYAHYSGTVEDFLVGLYDESAADRLKIEINKSKQEIERLTPELAMLKQQYQPKEREAVSKLQFYNSIGLDAYMGFIWQKDRIVDVLANLRIVEKNMEHDLEKLNDLYLQYRQVQASSEALARYGKLLAMIENNLMGRERFFTVTQYLKPEQIPSKAVDLWNERAVLHLEDNLAKDSAWFMENMKQAVTRETSTSPFRLEEESLNRISQLTYLFRSDHVYVQYLSNSTSAILIGTVTKDHDGAASLKFESGFIEGILISDHLISQLPKGFEIIYAEINPNSEGFYMEQTNGAILFHPIENNNASK